MEKKQKTTLAIILAITVMIFISGCVAPQPTDKTDVNKTEANETTDGIVKEIPEDVAHELVEKRGQKTNVTDFDELSFRASKIETFRFTLKDSTMDEELTYNYRLKFVKIELPTARMNDEGDKFDEVLMERVTKTALTHCSERNCEKDKQLEKTDYDEYYQYDPYERITRVIKPTYLGEEMLGDDYTKKFSMRYDGNPGTVWVQEYYGYPLKFEIDEGGIKRTIELKDMTINTVRDAEIQPPFNFTIKGEAKTYVFWDHYLGLWPKKKQGTVASA